MSTVDSRIVTMKFDNASFEKNAATTMSTLESLKKSLIFPTGKTALSGISSAAGKFSLGGVGRAIDGISGKFLALGTIAVTALSRMTNAAISAGIEFAKQFSGIDAAIEGFREYETKLGSIQAILANTKGENLKTVTAALDELNRYSDKTIYNFGEMVSNIKTFTVAGIDLETSVASVKGLANVAALTGTNAQEAAHATYQMAQAMSTGAVRLQDWISLEKAGGLAGKVFQDSLLRTARNHGVAVDDMIKKNGSFRLSLQEGWLSTEILNETLGQFAGVYDRAALKQMGYTQGQIDAIIRLQKQSEASATDIKTLTALVSTVKETMASGWAQTWEIIFGDLKTATALFTGINDALGSFIDISGKARNEVLKDWADLGGRAALFEGLGNIFEALFAILEPIGKAFREIFPPATGKQLADMSKSFRDFTEGLIIGEETAENIQSTFKGFFAILKLGIGILGFAVKYIAEFFGIIVGGGGGSAFLAVTGGIGDLITAIYELVTAGGTVGDFFEGFTDARNAVLEPIVGTIGKIVEALVQLARGDTAGFFGKLSDAGEIFADLLDLIADRVSSLGGIFEGFGGVVDAIANKLDLGSIGLETGSIDAASTSMSRLSAVADVARAIWDALVAAFEGAVSAIGPGLEGLRDGFAAIGEMLVNFISNLDFADLVSIINTGLFVAIIYNINRFIRALGSIGIDLGDISDSMSGAFDQLTGSLKTMQTGVRAKAILNIAIAIAILSASLIALSLVPMDKLQKGLGAIAALMGVMAVFLAVLSAEKLGIGSFGLIQASVALIAMSVAIGILAGALLILERVEWESIGKLAAILVAVGLAIGILGAQAPFAIAAGVGMLALSAGMVVMAGALMLFENVNWESIAKAAVVIAALALAVGLVGGLAPFAISGGAAMYLLSLGMIPLVGALFLLEKVDWSTIGKLAVVLTALALGVTAMSAAMPGALALAVVAASIWLLVPPLLILSTMSFGDIVGTLTLLGIGLTVLGVTAGIVSPLLLVLGTAVTLLGVGMLAAGTGMLAFGTGLTLVAAAGTVAFGVLAYAITTFLSLLPVWIKQFGESIKAFAQVISDAGPAMVKAMTTVMISLAKAVVKAMPDLRKALNALIAMGLSVLRQNFPRWVQTGIQMLLSILRGIRDNIPKIVGVATDIATRFIREIGKNSKKFTDAGADAVIDFVNGLADTIREKDDEMRKAGSNLGGAIVGGMVSGLSSASAVQAVISAATSIAENALNAIKKKIDSNSPSRVTEQYGKWMDEGLAIGLRRNAGLVEDEAENMADTALETLRLSMSRIQDVASNEIDMQPVIAPVLDLTNLQKNASAISGLLGTSPISPVGSYNDALMVSEDMAALREQQVDADLRNVQPREVKFEQNNYSPKALTPVEIYRNTRSQLALAEEALS